MKNLGVIFIIILILISSSVLGFFSYKLVKDIVNPPTIQSTQNNSPNNQGSNSNNSQDNSDDNSTNTDDNSNNNSGDDNTNSDNTNTPTTPPNDQPDNPNNDSGNTPPDDNGNDDNSGDDEDTGNTGNNNDNSGDGNENDTPAEPPTEPSEPDTPEQPDEPIEPEINPTQQAFNTLISNIATLEQLSLEYNQTDYQLRVLMYIRQFNYNNTQWSIVAGQVDTEFVTYVQTINPTLANYFDTLDSFTIPSTNEQVDFKHLFAPMNSILYSPITIQFHDLAGFGGDLVQLVNEINTDTSGQSIDHLVANKFNAPNPNNSSLSSLDLIADLDAVNIMAIYNRLSDKSISQAMQTYYTNLTPTERKIQFVLNNFDNTYPSLDQDGINQDNISSKRVEFILNRLKNNIYIYSTISFIYSQTLCGTYSLQFTNPTHLEIFNQTITAFVNYIHT